MLVNLTDEQVDAIRKLKMGIKFHNNFKPTPSDDDPIYSDTDNSLCEFAYGETKEDSGRLQVRHLRDIASIVLEENN
jgi:hypothetical protein